MPPKPSNSSSKKTEGKPILKACLQGPYNLTWPKLKKGVNSVVLTDLRKYLQEHPELKKVKSAGKRKRENTPTERLQNSDKQQSSVIRKHIFTGLNAITRKLERDKLDLVLVCKSAQPSILTQHLIPLCATRETPAACIAGLSEALSTELNLKSVLAFGISSAEEDSGLKTLVSSITRRITPLSIPWLQNNSVLQEDESIDSIPVLPPDTTSDNSENGTEVLTFDVKEVKQERTSSFLPTKVCINKSIGNHKQKAKKQKRVK